MADFYTVNIMLGGWLRTLPPHIPSAIIISWDGNVCLTSSRPKQFETPRQSTARQFGRILATGMKPIPRSHNRTCQSRDGEKECGDLERIHERPPGRDRETVVLHGASSSGGNRAIFLSQLPAPWPGDQSRSRSRLQNACVDVQRFGADAGSREWEYPHADGAPPRKMEVQQRRLCFTELSPAELPRHADEFGHFALEFEIDVLTIPVFYIPRQVGSEGEVTALGSILVIQIIDAMILAMRLAGVKKILEDAPLAAGEFPCTFGFTETKLQTFNLDVAETRKVIEAFTYSLTPPDMLEDSLTALLSFFYPADDIERNKTLAYYRQREWRIVGNIAVRREELMRRPRTEFVERLLEIDQEFFGREFPPSSGKRLADEIYVFPGIGEKRIIEMARRIIVPDVAVGKAKSILKCVTNPPPVIGFSDLRR